MHSPHRSRIRVLEKAILCVFLLQHFLNSLALLLRGVITLRQPMDTYLLCTCVYIYVLRARACVCVFWCFHGCCL